MKRADVRKIYQIIDSKRAVLFGAGFTAGLFCDALGQKAEMITACIVSDPAGRKSFKGIPVFSLDDVNDNIPEDSVFLVAVHETWVEEIEALLKSYGITNCLWIYPSVHELVFSKPVKELTFVPCEYLLSQQRDDENWLEIRYSAVKGFFEKTKNDIYIKGMELYCEAETARERLLKAGELASSMKRLGFLEEYPVLIDERYRIIDGMHRVACAIYLGIRVIPCRMVSGREKYEAVIPENVRAVTEVLKETFSKEEMSSINALKNEIREKTAKMVPAVSLILPVYNVAEYIDHCLESVTEQTFKDLEIILIDDGSLDGSGKKCSSWSENDIRIRFVSQSNEGVSSARSKGTLMARGTYIGFVDPDDWLEKDYVQELYNAATLNDADIAECDIYRYNDKTGKEVYRAVYGKMGIEYTKEEHMKYAPTASYKALYKRTLWADNGVRFPSCSFESPAIYALLRALAVKTVNIRKPLYHYRVGRKDSLIESGYAGKDGSADNSLGCEAMAFLTSEFKRTGLYDKYEETLNGLVKYRLSDILATQFTRRNKEEYLELADNIRRFLAKTFPGEGQVSYITWGGYNLNRELVYMPLLHDPYLRFNFQSMISLLGEKKVLSFSHRNRYREMMIEREFKGDFQSILEKAGAEYVFADLIEERFDILEYSGCYYTFSDAFEGIETLRDEAGEELESDSGRFRRIRRDSEECQRLWEKAFDHFTEVIQKKQPECRLIIVENYLSTQVGDAFRQEPFEDIKNICKKNKILSGYYDYIRKTYPQILMLPAHECSMYFTDKDYEYGAIPSHLNEVVNKRIAQMVWEKLRESHDR